MKTQTESSAASADSNGNRTYFDVRPISCRQKHAMIFQRWAALAPGEHFVLVNDHDPVPLYYQFAGQFPDAFTWEYLLAGPDEFHVRITRLKATPEPVRRPDLPPWPPRGNQVAGAGPLEVDARGLEPPEPMMRILAALETLPAGGVLRARTDRRPIHLLPELEARGMRHESAEQADGSWITTLRRG
jgi:Uncharacterized conserved protein